MSKKDKKHTLPTPPRASAEITQEYTNLCAEVGNALFQFEITKSQAFAKYQKLHEEMQRAVELEQKVNEKLQSDLAAKGENLVKLVANQVVNEVSK